MRKYEGVFIFAPNTEEEKREQVFNRLKGIMEEEGTIKDIDEWGNRKLAYEINDFKEGYYYIINFESTPEAVDELDRVSKITDSVIRHMIIRVDE